MMRKTEKNRMSGGHSDREEEDESGAEGAKPGRQALGAPAQRPVDGEPRQQDDGREDQLAHRSILSDRRGAHSHSMVLGGLEEMS